MSADFGKKDESPELVGSGVTKFRRIVGKLMYISGERPDARHAIQCFGKEHVEVAMKNAERVVFYLFGASGNGVLIDSRKTGQSVMDVRNEEEATELLNCLRHLIEVAMDADYAGNKRMTGGPPVHSRSSWTATWWNRG